MRPVSTAPSVSRSTAGPRSVVGNCGGDAKHAVLSLSPAASVEYIAGAESVEQGDAVRCQHPFKDSEAVIVVVSVTGEVKLSLSCVNTYNYSSGAYSSERVINSSKPFAEDGAPQVKAAATGAEVVAGGEVKLSVSGFSAEEGLSVDMYSTPVNLAKTKADKDGKVELTVRIPENTTEGIHHIVVTVETSGDRAITAIKVVKAKASRRKGDVAKRMMPKPGHHLAAGAAGPP